jgi:hypothetical protein
MNTQPLLVRQMQRCGRLPPIAEERLVRDRDEREIGFRDDHGREYRFMTIPVLDASTCAGYASTLPEVMDVVLAYPQWKERTLTEWIGAPPTPVLLAYLAAFEGGKNQCEADRIERQRKEAEARNGR